MTMATPVKPTTRHQSTMPPPKTGQKKKRTRKTVTAKQDAATEPKALPATVPTNTASAKRDPNVLYRYELQGSGRTEEQGLAETFFNPCVTAAETARYVKQGKMYAATGISDLVEELERQVSAVNNGDLSKAEGMLYAQAHSLEQVYARLTGFAIQNMCEGHGDAFERYMRMALRAQTQCRATLETLANIKNPPVVYARQANITNGPQQVNNGLDPRVRENESEQTKLLEETNGQRLDTAAPGTAGRADQTMEAVGAVNGAAKH
jgi:hypothetical protein